MLEHLKNIFPIFFSKKKISLEKEGAPKLNFNERGNIYIKPNDLIKSEKGEQVISKYKSFKPSEA